MRKTHQQSKERRVCTRCRTITCNWYPFSGTQKVQRCRCACCYENEVRYYVRYDNVTICAAVERKATISPSEEQLLEQVYGIRDTEELTAAVSAA